MKKSVFTALCATLMVSGCTMIPDYMRPSFSGAEKWDPVPHYTTKAGEVAASKLDWRSFFKSPELQKVIETALQNNRDLRIAAMNIDAARATYRITRADLVPSISADGSATYSRTSDDSSATGNAQKTELYGANVKLSAYELDLFGRVRSQNESALNDYLSTKAATDVVRNSLIAEVANAYLQLLADQKLLSLTQKTLEAQKNTYDLLKQSLKNGLSTDQDVARAETAVEIARVNLHQYTRFVAQDKNALFQLMGVPSNDDLISVIALDQITLLDNLDPGVPSDILLARPDIRQAEYTLMSRNADIGAARAAFFPQISLTGQYGFASTGLSSLFSGGAAGAYNFLPTISLPIFEGGRNIANLDLATIRKDQAIAGYEKAIQTAFREVADELAARATLDAQLGAQNRLVAAAQKVYDISDARYKAGVDSFLSVLDAQRELYTYQQTQIETERARLANLVNLYKVLGGGTPPEEIKEEKK